MKLLGLCILFAAAAMSGFVKSLSLRSRAAAIEEAAGFVREVGRRMRFSAEETGAVIRSVGNSGKFSCLPFLQDWANAIHAGKPPREALSGVLDQKILGADASGQLLSFAASLGRYDGPTLERIANEFAEKLAQTASEAQGIYKDKGRLYRGLGVWAGAALAVLLI